MYVTKPLSLLRRSPELLNLAPTEGPNSGYLILFDEECERRTCFGLSKETSIKALPFPQNKDLTVTHTTSNGKNNRGQTSRDEVAFIPVLDQPLSSNRYYVISRKGKHKGEAITSSTEGDMGTCCCCTYMKDIKPKPLDPFNKYQQVEIIKKNHHGRFTAESVAENGFSPTFLRRKWNLCMRTPRHYGLDEAPGLNSSLRSQLPDLISSNSATSKPVVVGKWYCPFMFVKELGGLKLKQQMKKSMFYEMTLEQRWDKVFECENVGNAMKMVSVDVLVDREEACVDGQEALCEWGHGGDGVIWFRSSADCGEGQDHSERLLGLSKLIMDRMRWEEQRVGLRFKKGQRQVKVRRSEKFDGKEWRKFGCYVLVERFVLKRVDGTILLTIDFKHANQIRCKWE